MFSIGRFASAAPVDSEGGWQDSVSRLHGSFRIKVDQRQSSYSGQLRWSMTDQFRVVSWRGEPEQLTRGTTELREDPRSMIELIAPLRGNLTLEHGNERFALRPGQIALVDLDGPVTCEHSEHVSAVCLIVPEEIARARLSSRTTMGPTDAHSGMGYVGIQTLKAIARQAEQLGPQGFNAACERLLDLAVLALNSAKTPPQEFAAETAEVVRQHIRANISDPDLNGQAIADASGWSLRHIQSVLQQSGTTPSELIRQERLALARMLLLDPARTELTIGRIAIRCGYTNHSVFSRSFRAAYGMSPQELRASHARTV